MRIPALGLVLLTGCMSTSPLGRPSVLLITMDTTRADHIGAYGYVLVETPEIDRLAAEGTRFTRAYSTCPLTIPSHSTILTGRAPPSHGVRDNGDFILGEDALLVSERLQEEGWTTAAFTAAFPTQRRWGFDQGFDWYHDPLERRPTQLDWRDQRRADEVVDDAISTLETVDGPVFAWVHLFDPHWPYEPPEPYASQYPERPYDGEIAWTSHEIGRLVDWWDGQHPDSLVVLTADHGEGLGDGGEQTHGFLLHDGTIRIPMIIRGTGVEEGLVIDDPVGHVDIVPTILSVAGLPPHEGLQGTDLRQGGSETMYSEALTGQYNLGLAPLFAYTEAKGRYMEGAWGGWYDVVDDSVLTVHKRDLDTTHQAETLALLRAKLDDVVAESATLDQAELEMLMVMGYMGGDVTAEAGEIDPRDVIDVMPLTWQARQALSRRRFGVAHQILLRLEQRMPDTFGVDQLRAQLHRARGALDMAFEEYADLYMRAPSSTLALQLASIAASQGSWEEAESWYREALEHQPASPEAMAGIVRSLQARGLTEEANEAALEYLVIYPDHAELMLIRAELMVQDERPADALEDAAAALQQMPWSPWAYTVNAQALWALGEADPAIELLQDALRLDPWNSSVRIRLAECLMEVGRHAEAVRTLAPLARLWPDDEEVQERYQEAQDALEAERSR